MEQTTSLQRVEQHTLPDSFTEELTVILKKYGYDLTKLLSMNVSVMDQNGVPYLKIQKRIPLRFPQDDDHESIKNREMIKAVMIAAHHGQPLIIAPQFTRSTILSTAVQKGILYYDTDYGRYRFTF